MNSYMNWGQGYVSDPSNYVSTDPSYDPYSGGWGNYVSTDPTYSAYGNSSGGMGMGSLWGAVLNGVGQYAQSAAQADAAANQSKLSAQAKLELQKQQREYDLQDRDYRKESVGKWSKYFS